jgi:hypothetical protein
MTSWRLVLVSAAVIGLGGVSASTEARAAAPKADEAARQRFATLLTSIKPTVRQADLRAFLVATPVAPATPVNLPPNRH